MLSWALEHLADTPDDDIGGVDIPHCGRKGLCKLLLKGHGGSFVGGHGAAPRCRGKGRVSDALPTWITCIPFLRRENTQNAIAQRTWWVLAGTLGQTEQRRAGGSAGAKALFNREQQISRTKRRGCVGLRAFLSGVLLLSLLGLLASQPPASSPPHRLAVSHSSLV